MLTCICTCTVIPSYPVYQNVNILNGYIRVYKSPKISISSYFSAKMLWVPAHCKISSENFVGARAPRTRRSAPHGPNSLPTISNAALPTRSFNTWIYSLAQYTCNNGYYGNPVANYRFNSFNSITFLTVQYKIFCSLYKVQYTVYKVHEQYFRIQNLCTVFQYTYYTRFFQYTVFVYHKAVSQQMDNVAFSCLLAMSR